MLSVGATPTAHAATTIDEKSLQLEGTLELYVVVLLLGPILMV